VKILYDRNLTPPEIAEWSDTVFRRYIVPMGNVWRMSSSNQYHIHFAIRYYCVGQEDREIESLCI